MIKTLLNADEEPSPKKEAVSEETITENIVKKDAEKNTETPPSANDQREIAAPQNSAETPLKIELPPETPREVFEIPADAKFFNQPESFEEAEEETRDFSKLSEDELEKLLEIEEENYKNFNDDPVLINDPHEKNTAEIFNSAPVQTDTEEKSEAEPEAQTVAPPKFGAAYDYEPETPAETIRKSGLAYSAAIVLIASVVFMMILGWFADLLLGSSPWGVVGGIILGGIVGFIQFFRISSSIFKK